MNLPRIADAAFLEAKRRAGEWISCASGCDDCCRKPFAITTEDAERLRTGIQETGLEDISQKADLIWQKMQQDFPGDISTGILKGNGEWREWFFEKHQGTPCPVLDEITGACRLYGYRPVCCRLYGPLIEIGGQTSDPCPRCFADVPLSAINATKVTIDLPERTSPLQETIIAAALISQKLQSFQSGFHSPCGEEPEPLR